MAVIILNTAPSAVIGTLTPLFGEFKVDIPKPQARGKMGGSTPSPKVINLSFKKYEDVEKYANYSNFEIDYEITGDDFFTVSGIEANDTITSSDVDFSIVYYNFPLLSVGKYSGKLTIYTKALNNDTGYTEVLETVVLEPEMDVDNMDLTINPVSKLAIHEKDTAPVFTTTLDVTCSGQWELLNSDVGNQATLLVNGLSNQHMQFAGDQTLTLTFSSEINELEIGYHTAKLYFYQPSLAAEFTLHIIVKEDDYVLVYPEELNFTAIRYVHEATPLKLYLYNPDGFSGWTFPEWCTVQEETIPGVSYFHILTIAPITSSSLEQGHYSGLFIATGTDSEEYIVPINHTVYTEWNFDYDKVVHFTKDNEELEIFSQSTEDSYVRLTGDIKVYDFDGNFKSYTREWSLQFLDGISAQINLGRELDDFLELIEDPIGLLEVNKSRSQTCYKPLSIKIYARETRYEDEQFTHLYALPTQYFLRGRRPKPTDTAFWLTHWPEEYVRVTRNSRIMLNAFKPEGVETEIQVKRNGELYDTILWEPEDMYFQPCFMKKYFNFAKIENLSAGERISFSIGTETRNFIVIPEQRHSVPIAWVNQFETLEIFEFMGEHELPIEYSSSLSETIKNWTDFVKKVEKSKAQSFKINTGWIFRKNAKIIDDLIDADRAYLIIPGIEVFSKLSKPEENGWDKINMVPVSKKMTAFDSKNNLIQFEVEFRINKIYEDAIYLR